MQDFKPGDTVRVCNPSLKTYRRVGHVTSTYFNTSGVEVQIPGLPLLYYKACNLELFCRGSEPDCGEVTNKSVKPSKGESEMCVKGDYKVALVRFVSGVNTTKDYAFALFDVTVDINDIVLVETVNGYQVAVVNNICFKADYENMGCSLPTKEVICKLDFTAFDERKERQAKAVKLKNDMDKMVKSLQEIAVFELLAEKSPELKAMLEEYKSIVD